MTHSHKIQAIRGMNDILPQQSHQWQKMEATLRQIVTQYGYHEIRFPILEQTALFQRSVGQVTDIVEKEMYTFTDRNHDSISLRPEGTAGCVRAGIQHGLFYNQIQRLFYHGPMFRHERPQAGRTRQFHHFGVEAYGMPAPSIDVELIMIAHNIWRQLQLQDDISLEINCIGDPHTRSAYCKQLVTYFTPFIDQLHEDDQKRLGKNPLRILDSKDPKLTEIIQNAPSILDMLTASDRQHFDTLLSQLQSLEIPYTVKPSLVRGLDYYDGIIYEWTTTRLGAQSAVCAGGRYDRLIGEFSEHACPAVGFAVGLERLLSLIDETHFQDTAPHFYLMGDETSDALVQTTIANTLRQQIPQIILIQDMKGGTFKKQHKRAVSSNAHYAMIVSTHNMDTNKIRIQSLRSPPKDDIMININDAVVRVTQIVSDTANQESV